ncbi:1938_t:CDS:2, partial [Scutellospora calospora]
IQTNLQQVDLNKYVFEIPDAGTINHIVVFLLGTVPFEPGYAATVHFLWPGVEHGWKLLGMLSNEKPSAIFRLRGSVIPGTTNAFTSSNAFSFGSTKLLNYNTDDMSMDVNELSSSNTTSVTATLGISIEPITMVESQIATLPQTSNQQQTSSFGGITPELITQITQNTLRNLYNYVTSFATSSTPFGSQIIGTGNTFISAKVFQDWYDTFTRKVKVDPNMVLKDDSNSMS